MKKSLLLVFLLVGCHDPFYVPPLSTATSSIVESSSINKVSTLNNELLHSEYLYYQGRHLYNNNKKIETIYHTSSGIELSFMGSSLSIQFDIVGSGDVYLRVALDEEILPDGQRIKVNQNNLSHNLFSNLDNSEHHITLLKESESTHGLLSLKSITTDGYFLPYQSKDRLKFLCLGASGISGHGALGSQGQGWSSNNSSSL
ncbi:MAG: hypothetical protein LBM99_04860 [Bacillales bacterium]|jgi:hypothetical protein|nr:hypothetical protein [Bacillales bacterium]